VLPPDVVSSAVLEGLGANVVNTEVINSALWLAAPTVKLEVELDEEAYVELPEYCALSVLVPTGSAVVTHWALLDEIVTAPQVPIVVAPASKLTVPVAPEVTAAVSVTDPPTVEEVGFALSEMDDAVPGTTGIRGDERRLYSE
jgi:hypothetical protein